ncbi:MAG: zinc-ribbon domain-containing protein [Deltaproteobacteria bacterium]|nr:zinc-ribbon domain-containing protein [Deltaproteobacteria bacterium]
MPGQLKFRCESCGTKYSMPEERVAGKILKIRCMKCSNLIVVKGGGGVRPPTAERPAAKPPSAERPAPEPAPPSEGASAAEQPAAPAGKVFPLRESAREPEPEDEGAPGGGGGEGDEWFYSKGGKQIGPVKPDDMRELIAGRVIGPKTYAWREGMEDWSRLSTMDDFKKELKAAAPTSDERRVSGARPAVPHAKSGVAEAARKRDEEIESEIASSGVFDDLLRDMDHVRSGSRPAVDDGDRFRKVAGIPVDESKKPGAVSRGRKAAGGAQAAASPEEDLPFVTSPRAAAPAEGAMFESVLEKEARRQAMEIAEADARESEEKARQMALAEPQDEHEEEPKAEPRESTRVIILKAGLSKKSRMKKVAVAAAAAAVVLSGLTWLVSTKLYAIYNLGLTIVKPQYAKPISTEEINMTPDERERYRKLMLGMEEEKKQQEQQVVKKKAMAAKKPGTRFSSTNIDTSGLADAYAGLGKEDVAMGRMDSDGKPLDIGVGVSGLGAGGLGVGGIDFGKKTDLPDLKPDLATTFKELTADQVGKVVATNQRSLSYCYEKHLKGDSGLSGKVMIWAEVKGTGKVSKVKSLTDRIRGSMIEECLVREIRKWQFPRFEGDATAIEIPLVLTSTF